MHKSQLIKALSKKQKISENNAKLCVDAFFDSMANALAKDRRIEIRGFGCLKVKECQPYKGRNPKTGKSVQVSQKKLPVFKTSNKLKKRINKKPTA